MNLDEEMKWIENENDNGYAQSVQPQTYTYVMHTKWVHSLSLNIALFYF